MIKTGQTFGFPQSEGTVTTKEEAGRFERDVLAHLDAAFNLAFWLTRDEDDARDVVQEASLRAFRYFSGFHGVNARGWLLTIVRNTFYTQRETGSPEEGRVSLDDIGDVESPFPDPETELVRWDDRRRLDDALAALPVEFREVIVLRELEGCSYKEIADIADIPVGTVMSRLARARKGLLKLLQGVESREVER